jgi:hypothetical protein
MYAGAGEEEDSGLRCRRVRSYDRLLEGGAVGALSLSGARRGGRVSRQRPRQRSGMTKSPNRGWKAPWQRGREEFAGSVGACFFHACLLFLQMRCCLGYELEMLVRRKFVVTANLIIPKLS